jgi:hypothetical protein
MTSWYFIEASPGDAAPATSPSGAAATIKSASWQEIRAILLESNCQLGEKTRYSPIVGLPKECEEVYGERPPSPVKQVVDKTLEELRDSFLTLGIFAEQSVMGDDFGSLEWPLAASKRYSEAIMANPRFQAVVERHVIENIKAAGFACADCPARAPLPKATVSLDQLMRYLSVMGWPDPVRLKKNPDGTDTNEPKYGFHICSGLNGLSTIQDPRPELESAAPVLAFAVIDVLREKTGDYFMQVKSSPEFTALRNEADQQTRFARETELLQHELPAKLFADSDLRKAAIEAVEKLSDDVGLTLEPGTSPEKGCPACLLDRTPSIAAQVDQVTRLAGFSARLGYQLGPVTPHLRESSGAILNSDQNVDRLDRLVWFTEQLSALRATYISMDVDALVR